MKQKNIGGADKNKKLKTNNPSKNSYEYIIWGEIDARFGT